MPKASYCRGVGVDLVKISRFSRLLEMKNTEFVGRFISRILHPSHEVPKFRDLQKSSLTHGVSYLAGSWAAKEALYKTLDTDHQRTFEFRSWYRDYNSNGRPTIKNVHYPHFDEEFHLSISHDHDMLIATVLRQQVFDLSD